MANKRLIDANALIFHLGEEPMVWSDGEAEIQERNDWRRFKACVEAQDTVDAVEVVRCKDCKYWLDGFCDNARGMDLGANENGFCSSGERRSDV